MWQKIPDGKVYLLIPSLLGDALEFESGKAAQAQVIVLEHFTPHLGVFPGVIH